MIKNNVPATAAKDYKFQAKYVSGSQDLSGEEHSIELKGDEAILDGEYKGTVDTHYKPRFNKDFVRYTGFEGHCDNYLTSVLVQKPMLAGAPGRIKVQDQGETFFTETFDCTPKK